MLLNNTCKVLGGSDGFRGFSKRHVKFYVRIYVSYGS